MRLVVVTAVLRQRVPLRRVGIAQARQCVRETQHPCQCLRGEARLALEQLRQVLAAVAEFGHERLHFDLAMGLAHPAQRPAHRVVRFPARLRALQQPVLEAQQASRRIVRVEQFLAERAHAIPEHRVEVQHLFRQFVLRDPQHPPRAQRLETHAEQRAGAGRVDIEETLLLAGEPGVAEQLRCPHAVHVEQALRCAEVEHQVGIAARQDARDLVGVAAFHAPQELHRVRQPRVRQQDRERPPAQRRIVPLDDEPLACVGDHGTARLSARGRGSGRTG